MLVVFFFCTIQRPTSPTRTDTLFPYTQLFLSQLRAHFLATFAASGHLGPGRFRSKPAIPHIVERRGTGNGASFRGAFQIEFALCRHDLISDRKKRGGCTWHPPFVFLRRSEGYSLGSLQIHGAGLAPLVCLQLVGQALLLFERARTEEHTSELQSLMRISYAVFCLKKKNKNTTSTYPK